MPPPESSEVSPAPYSMRLAHSTLCVLSTASALVLFTGCATGKYANGSADADTSADAELALGGRYADAPEGAARKFVQLAYPTGDARTSTVLLEKEMPEEIVLGATFEYRIAVQNLTDVALDAVTVADRIPAGMEVTASEPAGEMVDGLMEWSLGTLAPRASKSLSVTGVAREAGELTTLATVTYDASLAATALVVAPALSVAVAAPTEGNAGEPFDLTVTVTNTGTGIARDVRVVDELPEGLTTVTGQRRVVMDFGDLEGEQTKEKTIAVQGSAAGAFAHAVSVESAGGLQAEAESVTTLLRQPRLALTVESEDTVLAGRPYRSSIVVANTGDGTSDATDVFVSVPSGVEIVESEGAVSGDNGLRWDIGALAPGEWKELVLVQRSVVGGTFVNEASAKGTGAVPAVATLRAEVRGRAALALGVVDASDLILVGEPVTYTVTVTNQGSAPDKDVVISCEVEDGVEIVSTDGAAEATVSGRTALFAAIPTLEAGDSAEVQVTVKSASAGDRRFAVSVTSESKPRPVTATEATDFVD